MDIDWKSELENMQNYHSLAMQSIAKICGEDISDEPRLKWVEIIVSDIVKERDEALEKLAAMENHNPVAVIDYKGYEPANSIRWLDGNSLEKFDPGQKLYANPVTAENPAPLLPDGLHDLVKHCRQIGHPCGYSDTSAKAIHDMQSALRRVMRAINYDRCPSHEGEQIQMLRAHGLAENSIDDLPGMWDESDLSGGWADSCNQKTEGK